MLLSNKKMLFCAMPQKPTIYLLMDGTIFPTTTLHPSITINAKIAGFEDLNIATKKTDKDDTMQVCIENVLYNRIASMAGDGIKRNPTTNKISGYIKLTASIIPSRATIQRTTLFDRIIVNVHCAPISLVINNTLTAVGGSTTRIQRMIPTTFNIPIVVAAEKPPNRFIAVGVSALVNSNNAVTPKQIHNAVLSIIL